MVVSNIDKDIPDGVLYTKRCESCDKGLIYVKTPPYTADKTFVFRVYVSLGQLF